MMMMMLVMGVWITFDEAMSAYQPCSTKTGGLPKPLGTEGKTACDCATGVMIHFEIQEGRDAMRLKEHAPELGVTAACTLRMAERSAPAGATVLGDSWFASVKYFARSPRVDNYNQSRQHDLMLEEVWLTHDCWFRLHTTMAGIHVTDCWKLAKHHPPRHHPLKESTVVNFADLMCKALIYNGLTGEVKPTRRTERVLADITNEPPPLPHSIMHLGKRPGNDNATKQDRCTMCRVDDNNVN
eukprot:jgi/Tetstr1/438138/TSEL_002864.t1